DDLGKLLVLARVVVGPAGDRTPSECAAARTPCCPALVPRLTMRTAAHRSSWDQPTSELALVYSPSPLSVPERTPLRCVLLAREVGAYPLRIATCQRRERAVLAQQRGLRGIGEEESLHQRTRHRAAERKEVPVRLTGAEVLLHAAVEHLVAA